MMKARTHSIVHLRKTNPARFYRHAIVVMVALMVMAVPASAVTLKGATGLITKPSADTLTTGESTLGFRFVGGKAVGSFSYGVFDNLELGVHTDIAGQGLFDVGFAAKFNLLEETKDSPAVAVGAETGRGYVTVSKMLASRLRGHLGYAFGSDSALYGGVALNLATAAVQGRVSLPPTTLMAELDSNGQFNAGARFYISPAWSADVALYDMKHVGIGLTLRSQF